MRVAIVGSQRYATLEKVRERVHALKREDRHAVIVTGGAKGVDQTAEQEAVWIGLPPPLVLRPVGGPFRHKGAFRAAAMARNREIVGECDRLIAFWDGDSNGTANAVTWAVALGKPHEVVL